MARKNRTMVGPDDIPSGDLTPKHLTKQEFGKRVYDLMQARGWRQSDLARHSGLPRDSVSTYILGKSLPTAPSLAKLAKAFGVRPSELLPNHIENAITDDIPAFEIRVSPNAPGTAWMRINRAVPVAVAMKIAALLGDADAADKADGASDVS